MQPSPHWMGLGRCCPCRSAAVDAPPCCVPLLLLHSVRMLHGPLAMRKRMKSVVNPTLHSIHTQAVSLSSSGTRRGL